MMEDITAAEARRLFKYDEETGKIFFRVTRGRAIAGEEARSAQSNGYLRTYVCGKSYFVHRLVWLIEHGEWPEKQIDHINGNRDDNRLENLRTVSCQDNKRNTKRPANNTSGVTGVYWHKTASKWHASIRINRRQIHLGLFIDKNDAVIARKTAEREYGFHENHGRTE